MVTPASVQDRHGARLLWRLRADCRGIRLAWADAGYAGKLTAGAAATLHLAIEVVRKRDAHAFEVLPPPPGSSSASSAVSASTAAASATTSACLSTTKPWSSAAPH